MTEDKLERDERIRLEALAQGVQLVAMSNRPPPQRSREAVRCAKVFEAWIREGTVPVEVERKIKQRRMQ